MDTPGSHVEDVPALDVFAQLKRSLSTHPNSEPDLEKDAPFDLREYLSSTNHAAGTKHKHVGVTWEDLEVAGVGDLDSKVSFVKPYCLN